MTRLHFWFRLNLSYTGVDHLGSQPPLCSCRIGMKPVSTPVVQIKWVTAHVRTYCRVSSKCYIATQYIKSMIAFECVQQLIPNSSPLSIVQVHSLPLWLGHIGRRREAEMINGGGKAGCGFNLRSACPIYGSSTISEEMFSSDKVSLMVLAAVFTVLPVQMRFAEVPAMTHTLPTLSWLSQAHRHV